MARIFKDHGMRRNEILDAAQRLVYTKGYEQMTIQDILDDLQISKGAFYHYFDSKQALLEAFVERMLDEVEQILIPIVQDSQLPSLEKFQRYFDTATRWKTAQKDFVLAIFRTWYADDNAIVRQKVYAMTVKRIGPMLTQIIHQGIQESAFRVACYDQVGEVVLSLLQGMGDALAGSLFALDATFDYPHVAGTVAAYTRALERVLGAPEDSLHLIDDEILKEWVVLLEKTDEPIV